MPNIPQINVGGTVYKLKDAELRDKFDDLKSALDENAESLGDALHLSPLAFALIKSGNIIGPTTGDEASNASYSYTANYLPVHAGNQYRLISTGKLYGAWYDSDKMYISGLQYDTASVDATVTAPNNAAFVRVSCLTANIDDLDIIPYQVFSSPDVKQANLSISYENYRTYLPTLADAALNTIYNITMRSDSHQSDYPTKMGYTTLTLITIGTSLYKEQYVLPTWVGGACAKRRYYNSAWHDWEYSYDDNARFKRITHVSYTDYESLLPTLADAVPNSIYFITMRANAHPSDYPTALGYNTYTLLTITDEGLTYKEQYVFPTSPSDKTFAKRRFYSSVWHDWEYFDISNYFTYETMPVNYENYMTYLPTLANAKMDSVIVLTMSPDAHQVDYPVGMGYTTNELITIGAGTYAIQYMLSTDVNGKIAKRRFYSSAWHDWEYTNPSRGSIVIGTGEQYETLTEGLDAAYRIGNCDVTIRPETFDIVAEMQELYGSDYFENESFTNRGILIGKGNKYYFESGSQVNCVLPSNASEIAQNRFSPFKSGDGNYEIIGLRVYTEFCRYCVHDEMDGVGNYHHIYKDCYMHQNDTGAGYIQCIGGGLGAHGLIDIDGCVFESDTAESNDEGIVSWHNGSPANIQSFINIRNCYFINGHVRFSWYGESELVSEMCISGCSFKNTVYDVRAENPSALIRNISVREWNNEVRN